MKKWHVSMGPHRFVIVAKTRDQADEVLDLRCNLLKLKRAPATFKEIKT